jgi:diamine N-acetyltransferase
MAIRLVPLALEHLPHVMTWVNDHEVMQYFANRQRDISEAEERAYIEQLIASKNDRVFSIFDDEAYVGQCSVNQIYWPARNGRAFLVVTKATQHGGRGTQAMRELLAQAFGPMGLEKVWLIVRKDNRAAQAMYLKLGFEFEGVLRREYCVGDTYFDMVRMAAFKPAP